jgi:hypothetical protein
MQISARTTIAAAECRRVFIAASLRVTDATDTAENTKGMNSVDEENQLIGDDVPTCFGRFI